jgi:RNA polymerase sigma factor (sigma-70 family)
LVFGRQAVAVGERQAELADQLARFFADHYDRLVRLAALVCHSNELVEDAVQAAMEQAWRRRHTLRDQTRMRPWLDQIVVREAIRLNRPPWWTRGTRPPEQAMESVPDRHAGSGLDASLVALTIGFRKLPVEQRAVVALHLYEGYSVDETARLTGAGLETTRSRLRLARQRLRRELAEEEQ